MVIPIYWLLLGIFFGLAYFTRSKVTYTNEKGSRGSLAIALIVFVFGAGIGLALDIWTSWSVIPMYMNAAGGTLQIIAWLFFIGFLALCGSMLYSTAKCGQMVA